MAKRGASGLSRLVAVNKPCGMTSHDVVNRVRRICGERRVGHTGTLDPLASGVLMVCVGPATRLDAFMVGHGKRYRMGVLFGVGTDTDDDEGAVIKTRPVPDELFDRSFAERTVASLVGPGTQVPPIYSAIKVDGRRAYDAARAGSVIDLEPRPFEVYDAELIDVVPQEEAGELRVEWVVEMSVSKGTYMRSIARDLGRDLKTAAHVSSLERTRAGSISLDECVTLEELEADPAAGVIDPLRALGFRFAFVREGASRVENGSPLAAEELSLNEPLASEVFELWCCTTSIYPSSEPPHEGEVVAVVVDRRVKALYEYQESQHRYRARCVFSVGVERGTGL